MDQYYLFIIFMTVFTSLIMVAVSFSNAMLPKREKNLFICLFLSIIAASLCEWGGVALNGGGPEVRFFVALLKATEFSLAPSLAILYAAAITPNSKSLRIAMVCAVTHAATEWALAPFGVVFYIDDAGVYHHGSAYLFYIAAYAASALYLLNATRQFTKTLQYRNRHLPWFIMAFVGVCVVGQMVHSETRTVWLGLVIGATLLYVFYCSAVQQTDGLTRLLNRYSFESTLSQLKKASSIIVFDVDNFKFINDTYGHDAGDACLKGIGRAIYQAYSLHGSCFRVGGDEFCVVLTDPRANSEKLRRDFETKLDVLKKGDSHIPTVSIGEARIDPAHDDPASAYRNADKLMYECKQRRKAQQAEQAAQR